MGAILVKGGKGLINDLVTRHGRPFRLEKIVNLDTGETVGHELLQGARACGYRTQLQWRRFYEDLAVLIPGVVARLDGPLFVNVNGDQFIDRSIRESLMTLTPLTSRLVFEWTETPWLSERNASVRDAIEDFRDAGFVFAIDDIGTCGVDPIWRLQISGAAYAKIDGGYFHSALESTRGRSRLAALIRMLRDIGTRVVVEWIETPQHYQFALQNGAHYGQGYLFSDFSVEVAHE